MFNSLPSPLCLCAPVPLCLSPNSQFLIRALHPWLKYGDKRKVGEEIMGV